jgi:Spy/CpxP family protein refolding chaperone
MKLRTISPCLLGGIIIAVATLSSPSQESTNAPAPKAEPARRSANMPGRPLDEFGPAFSVLTEEQRMSLARAMQAEREKSRELESKLRNARRDLVLAGVNTNTDEAAIRKQAQTFASLEAEIAVLRAKALSQIHPPLSAEQIERIKTQMSSPRPPETRPPDINTGRQRILQGTTRDENDLPSKP